ncbi:MAG TPA: hypothetical protein VI685_09440 [Candidatus Angelobacter sp.]
MSWETFYLICFAGGFLFSVLSFLSGTLSLHLHLPKFMGLGDGGHGAIHAGGGAHVHGVAGHGAASGHHGSAKASSHGGHFSFFNPITMAAFLTWFGGTGYLLVHLRHVWVFTGLLLSTGAGMVGAAIVFWFVAKVLMANERALDPLDYEMVGVLGKVSSSIRSGGTGEIIFSQEGVRRPCAARCETGESLAKGVEVIVTKYERGVAYVRPWQELADSAGIAATEEQTKQ